MTAHYVLREVRSTAVHCDKLQSLLLTVEVYLTVLLISAVGGVE